MFDGFGEPKKVFMRTDAPDTSVINLGSGVLDGNFREDAEVILLDATVVVK